MVTENKNENHDITVQEILKVTGGELITGEGKENVVINNYCFDSRKLKEGDMYLGVKGEQINGGIYFPNALEDGAIGCIVQEIEISNKQKQIFKDKIIIKVQDTVEALMQIATYKRSLYKNLKVVAVTGSVGKTSTKDIIASVISQKYKTLKTQANFNNHIGVPLTVLSLQEHEVLVVEMGMNHKGEISKLTRIAKPDICVITNVGTSHIGNLGSRENILRAKLEILEGSTTKNVIINNDNDMLHAWAQGNIEDISNKDVHIHTFGIDEQSNIMATDIDAKENGTSFKCIKNINSHKEEFNIYVPVGGKHFVYNALCATQVGSLLNIETEKIQEGIHNFELTQKRMQIDKLANGIVIINDAYNASYESMKAALEYVGSEFKEYSKIAILGDMLELGEYSEKLHKEVGEEVAKNNIDVLICSGKLSKDIISEAKHKGMPQDKTFYFEQENKEERNNKILETIEKEIAKTNNKSEKENKKVAILIKASNSMQFYKIAEDIKNKMSEAKA